MCVYKLNLKRVRVAEPPDKFSDGKGGGIRDREKSGSYMAINICFGSSQKEKAVLLGNGCKKAFASDEIKMLWENLCLCRFIFSPGQFIG